MHEQRLRKNYKKPIMAANNPAETQTRYLPNRSLPYSNLLSICSWCQKRGPTA